MAGCALHHVLLAYDAHFRVTAAAKSAIQTARAVCLHVVMGMALPGFNSAASRCMAVARKQNGEETEIDCGGDGCPKCAPGGACLAATDCTSSVCHGGMLGHDSLIFLSP